VFFVSTIGSVLGVFVVAYGILPFVTNYKSVAILTLAAAALSIIGLWQMRRTERPLFIAALAAFLITLATLGSGGLERFASSASLHGATWKIVTSAPSTFGNLKVVDLFTGDNEKKDSRLLLNDGMTQNDFNSYGQPASLYTYALERLALAASPDARKALVLGIGGGTVPANFVADSMDVHAVDINQRMVDFSRENFGFDTTGMTIEIADARVAARACSHDYDVVVVDLFRGDGIPEHLVTQEFFTDIKNCLKDQGVMVMNTFMSLDDQRPEFALLQTISSVFGESYFAWEPRNDDFRLTSAFIVVRKGGPVGKLQFSGNNMPGDMANRLLATMQTACVVRRADPFLKGAPILTDVSNQWKNLSHPVELAYRTLVAGYIPWQMLLN
jgi:predicted membrane-bound spermidine synthase